MKMIDCQHFITCSAPICPLSKKSIDHCAWMVGEPICKNIEVRKNKNWIIKQRRLNRKIKDNFFEHGLFTVEMLEHLKNITSKTTGLKDIKKKAMYQVWMHNHPKTTKSLKQVARDLKLTQNGAALLAKYRLSEKKV